MKVFVIYLLPVILVLFMSSSILSANSAFGLSCDATNMTWSFEETDAIFLGKALSKEYQPNPRHEDRFDAVTLFSIIEPYKGIYQKEISVISSEWLWGVNFTENSDYVIFANNNDGMFEHALCTPTRLASESNLPEIQKISQRYILPPLVQLEFGANPNAIQCKQNLVLIQKYDGSSACVTESTKTKLVERGWTKSSTWTASYEIPTVIIPLGSGSVDTQKNFEPQTIKVVLGVNNTVRWINQDDVPSSINSDHDYNGYGFTSPHLKPGDSWTHTFTKAGVYDYHSIPHPWKNGKIIVEER